MKIVVCDMLGFEDEHVAWIHEAAEGDTLVFPNDDEELVAELADAEVFFGYHSPEVFAGADNLKWIQTTSAGLDMMLTPEIVAMGLQVTNASGLHAPPVVETAWALTLAVSRCLRHHGHCQDKHEWDQFVPWDLNGRTAGVIGLGGIGRRYAKIAAAFGMRVIAVDLHSPPKPDEVEELWGLDRLNDLCAEADVVMIACPATQETQGLIGAEQLALMKSTAILVNIARGGIVDEPALIECLNEGRIVGAGLDVTKIEPLPADDPLWDTPRLVITPHIAGWSNDRSGNIAKFFCENLGRYKAGEPLRNLVDQERGYPVPGS
ncbi:MAG: D-2-hydroxyacid dehydrogenase [Planctomycetaceae bacterium]